MKASDGHVARPFSSVLDPNGRDGERPNWAARWARSLTMHASRRSGPVRSVLLLALITTWLGLTGYGSFLEGADTPLPVRIGDIVYGPFTFLQPQDAYRHGSELSNDFLRWGRLAGATVSVFIIGWAFLLLLGEGAARWLIRRFGVGHILILARGGAADRLARTSSAEGASVVLAEAQVEPQRALQLARGGVIILPEEPGLEPWLARGAARRVRHLLVWDPSDGVGLAQAVSIGRTGFSASRDILVRVESPIMQRSLRHARELLEREDGRLRPVSLAGAAVRGALGDASLVAEAHALGQSRVHVWLAGGSDLLPIIASQVLRHNWSVSLAAPQVSVPANTAFEKWRSDNGSLFDCARFAFGEEHAPVITSATADKGDQITRYLIDEDNDDQTIEAAFGLASRLARECPIPPAVQCVLREAHAVQLLFEDSRSLRFAPPILIESDCSLASILARNEDRKAARIHEIYLRQAEGLKGAALESWTDLPETFIHANRGAADHMAIKAFDADWISNKKDMHDGLLEMAMVEHRRWMADRFLDGWRPGTVRDDARLLHDQLKHWDQLSESERNKDFDQVRLHSLLQ